MTAATIPGDMSSPQPLFENASSGSIGNATGSDLPAGETRVYSSAAAEPTARPAAQVNNAPYATGIDADIAVMPEGGGPVRLDAGRDARLTDLDNNGFVVERAGNGYGTPLFAAPIPDGSGRVFVVAKLGQIYIFDPSTGQKTLFLDIQPSIDFQAEQGLLGFATAPDFATSGTFYVYATNLQGDNEIRRYQVRPDDPDTADPTSADVIFTIPHPFSSFHNGGWIGFGPDNNLYISTGDGSDGGDGFQTAQDPNSLLGKMLRIDVAGDDFPDDPDRDYAIPIDNPFSDGTGAAEVWALGLRNAFRNSFDAGTGKLYIADVGQGLYEEVNVVDAATPGTNLGWSILEGTHEYRGGDTTGLIAPVIEYGHGSGPSKGSSVTGGYVYRGAVEALQGKYFFGDFITANIWGVDATALNAGVTLDPAGMINYKTAFAPATGSIGLISSFGVDEAGNLYIADFSDGEVYRIVPSAETNFAAGSLRVTISGNKVATEDELRIDVSAGSDVTLSNGQVAGSAVRVGGILVGTIAAAGTGLNGEDLVISFASGATPARVSALVQTLQYNNTNDIDPVPGSRTITYTIVDGAGTANGGSDTLTFSSTVYMVALNDAPAGADGSVVVTQRSGYVFSIADFNFSDADGNGFAGVVVTSTVDAGLLSLNGSRVADGQFVSAATIVAGGLVYTPGANGTGTGFTFQVRDAGPSGGGNQNTDGSPNVMAIDVRTGGESPVLLLQPGGEAPTYSEGGPLIAVAARALVTDADSDDFGGGRLSIALPSAGSGELAVGDGSGRIVVSGSTVSVDATVIATMAADAAPGTLEFDLNAQATSEAVTTLLRSVTYANRSNTPPSSITVTVSLSDGDGGVAQASATINITALDDAPVARNDAFSMDEDAVMRGNLFADNGNGMDVDIDGPTLSVATINGVSYAAGVRITLASGALLTVEADGSFAYDPNGVFNYLPGTASGASNALALDGFDYTLTAGGSAAVAFTIRGRSSAADVLLGTSGSDQLRGSAGNDRLTGLGGGDFLYGEGGDDVYVVYPGDRVFEAIGGGFDTVRTNGSYQLRVGAEIEVLATVDEAGLGAFTLVGNEFNQTIRGNADDNRLIGLGGRDVLIGGLGNDTYAVDSADDLVIEEENGGFDTVSVQTSYTLAADAEIELFATAQEAGTGGFTLIGNRFAQTVYGNAGANTLAGGGGADTLIGLGGNDFYIVDADDRVLEAAGGGYDTVVTSQNYRLAAGAEIELFATSSEGGTTGLTLIGNGFSQYIYGNAGANTLVGGGGTDRLIGLSGNDTFVVDSIDDVVIDGEGGGYDTVSVQSSYTLPGHAEIELMATGQETGTAAFTLIGNSFAQTIYGNAGANVIDGRGGADTMIGLGGADTFLFSTPLGPGNVDRILDFQSGIDRIALDSGLFAGLPGGVLAADAFAVGDRALEADDRIIYNRNTGALFFDADGSGEQAAVQFAVVAPNIPIVATDFVFV